MSSSTDTLPKILQPEMREGAQSAEPGFYSQPSKPIRSEAIIEKILGPAFDEAFFIAGAAIFGPQETYTLFAVLTFNSQDRAVLRFYDTLEQPNNDYPDRPEPRTWQKKFPDDGGQMKAKADQLMGWS